MYNAKQYFYCVLYYPTQVYIMFSSTFTVYYITTHRCISCLAALLLCIVLQHTGLYNAKQYFYCVVYYHTQVYIMFSSTFTVYLALWICYMSYLPSCSMGCQFSESHTYYFMLFLYLHSVEKILRRLVA